MVAVTDIQLKVGHAKIDNYIPGKLRAMMPNS